MIKILSNKDLSNGMLKQELVIEINLYRQIQTIAKKQNTQPREIILQALKEFIQNHREKRAW